ncbi:MAG: hypothetical protein LIP23_05595 [Planctomycetes bacterium]|nr:hypothetical protein [Planctomycetota bacterium]
MKASEGKIGRVFMLRLEDGDKIPQAIEQFAVENGILSAQVFAIADQAMAGIIAPDPSGAPKLRLSDDMEKMDATRWADGEVVVQEVLGVHFLRMRDPRSGRETLARVASTKTRVMEKAAPEPEESGPGTIPVYLFNVEFN